MCVSALCVVKNFGITVDERRTYGRKEIIGGLRRCLEGKRCKDCSNYQSESRLTCPSLLQKAYEVVKRYEEMLLCNVGDKLYCPNQYTKMIAEFEVAEIYTFKDGTVIIDDLENKWDIEDIGKTIFLTRPEAEQALKEMED